MVKKVWNFIPILHISLICGKKKCCKIQRIRGRKRGSRRYYKRFQKLKLVFVDLCFCCIHGTLLTLYWDSFSLLGPYGQIPKPLWPHRLAGSRWAVGRWQRGAPSAQQACVGVWAAQSSPRRGQKAARVNTACKGSGEHWRTSRKGAGEEKGLPVRRNKGVLYRCWWSGLSGVFVPQSVSQIFWKDYYILAKFSLPVCRVVIFCSLINSPGSALL